jgi:ABC-type lipoprotein release transport system permease subunit
MPPGRLLRLVGQNILRNKKNFVFSSVGILVGVTLFSFFLALASGIRERVLNRVYPINQVEIEPVSVNLAGFKSEVRNTGRLDQDAVTDLEGIPGVVGVYPKQRSKLASMYKGGSAIFGNERYFEAFFDGLDPALLWEELAEKEGVERKRRRFEARVPVPCETDGDCKPGFECRADETAGEGVSGAAGASAAAVGPARPGARGCRPLEYWRHFRYTGQALPCAKDEDCVAGEGCVARRCEPLCGGPDTCGQGARCVALGDAPFCAPVCAADGDCPLGRGCVAAACGDSADCLGTPCDDGACALAGVCQPLPCRLRDPNAQNSDGCDVVRGTLAIGCDPAQSGETCPPVPCPEGTYCAADAVTVASGVCEAPVPVVLSPFLLEMYNAVAGPQMQAPRIDGPQAMVGLEMRMTHGESLITWDMRPEQRIVKRIRLVGFSDKALDLGVTVPIEYVRRVNAHYRGRPESARYDTAILQTRGNEDVTRVTLQAEERGFTLSRKSEDARKAGTMLFVLTLVFGFISVVILFIAAVNITHTFLMIVYERKHEIGIMRAIGANRWDTRALVLAEAGFIGLFGGALGNATAFGLSRVANALSDRYLAGVPFRPDDLFVFTPTLVVGSVGFALLFCLIGAFFPANRAARLDPAEVLTSK